MLNTNISFCFCPSEFSPYPAPLRPSIFIVAFVFTQTVGIKHLAISSSPGSMSSSCAHRFLTARLHAEQQYYLRWLNDLQKTKLFSTASPSPKCSLLFARSSYAEISVSPCRNAASTAPVTRPSIRACSAAEPNCASWLH